MKKPGPRAYKAWKKFVQTPGSWDYSKNDWADETPRRTRRKKKRKAKRKKFLGIF